MEMNDFTKKINELASKIEGSLKTPEEKKKYLEALNNPEIQKKVDDSMIAVNEIFKKLMSND